MEMSVNHVFVTVNGIEDMTVEEVKNYIEFIQKKYGRKPIGLTIFSNGEEDVDLEFTLEETNFERIRRITGYLVGTVDRFNDAKRVEEHDRVKHTI